MNFGFEQLLYEMPAQLIPVDTLAHQAGFGEEMVARMHSGGLRRVPVGDGSPLFQLVRRAVARLSLCVPEFSARAKGVVFAHSVPLLAPANVPFLSMCLEALGLDGVNRVAITGQPCSVLHLATRLAGYWLEEVAPGCGVVIIGADQAYSPEERLFFGSAMGDVAVAGFATRESRHNLVLASVSECEIIAWEGERSPAESIAHFRQLNPLYIRHAIESCLQTAGVELGDLAFIVPHTPYTMIWDTMAELLRFPRERILTDYLCDTGHLNSNDSFVHYTRAVHEERIHDGALALLVNPGFGGTRGCTLLRR